MINLNSNRFRKHRYGLIALYTVFFVLIIYLFIKGPAGKSNIVSPLPDEPKRKSVNPLVRLFIKDKNTPEELIEKIKSLANPVWNNYSVYVRDLNSDFEAGIAESVTYTAASVNKIPILAALYFQAQNGSVDLDQQITLQKNDIQDYGTGSIRYDPPGTTYSLRTLARLMIAKSDNTAAYIISNHILGINNIQKLVESWGLTQTDMVKNKTSNKDISILFEKIYSQKITNNSNTMEMLSFLKNTDFENRLPAKLPKNALTYHKIGTEVGIVHDAGIIQSPNKTYYIGIFTSDLKDEKAAESLIAQISLEVFNFLSLN